MKVGGFCARYNINIKSIKISNGITSIPEGAFYDCNLLENIEFPPSIATIGSQALIGTMWERNLLDGEIYVGKVYYGYRGEMPAGTRIEIKEGTKSIFEYAFYNCEGLTSIAVPDSVTSIGQEAFEGTVWLENQPDGDVYIGKVYYMYKGEMPEEPRIEIKEGTQSIGAYAFRDYSGLTSITIPDSVKSIGYAAFDGCTGLTNITIPEGVTSIGCRAFSWCTSITNITIPSGIRIIREKTFYCCWNLTNVTILDGVKSIGYEAFYGCKGLTNITIPDSVTNVEEKAFEGNPWLENKPDGDVYVGKVYYGYKGEMPEDTSIEIKDGTVAIEDYAFFDCIGLTRVIIPNSVTSIGNHAFDNCIELTNITIPDGVKCIGNYAFLRVFRINNYYNS